MGIAQYILFSYALLIHHYMQGLLNDYVSLFQELFNTSEHIIRDMVWMNYYVSLVQECWTPANIVFMKWFE